MYTSTKSMATKLVREAAFHEKMLSRKSKKLVDYVDTSDHMINKKRYISISTRPVPTELERVVAYDNKPQT